MIIWSCFGMSFTYPGQNAMVSVFVPLYQILSIIVYRTKVNTDGAGMSISYKGPINKS